MFILIVSVVWLLFVATLLIRAIRQSRYFEVVHDTDETGESRWPSITVVTPARNEEPNLRQCIEGLLSQDYPRERLRIVIVDDQSCDATGTIARTLATEDDRVRVISADPLPAGWAGKAHACWQGAAAAGECDWLCFVDADTRAGRHLLKVAVHEAQSRGLGLLSLSPAQELVGIWERIVMPAAFFLLAVTQDLSGKNASDEDFHANGQFLTIRRDVYDRIGGYAAVRSSVAEDSAIARLVRRHGDRAVLLGTQGLIRARMYRDLPSLWAGLARQATELFRSPAVCRALAIGAIVIGWAAVLIPAIAIAMLATRGPHSLLVAAIVLSLAASLSLLGTHIATARYFHIPIIYGLVFPVSYTMGAGLLLTAARWRRRGQVQWKGRKYVGADRG